MEQIQELKIFENYLAEKNMHLTRSRKVILQVFLQRESHWEITELYEEAKRKDNNISLASVYRTMNLLVKCGLAQENVILEDKKCFGRVYGPKHHDHLVCTRCNKIEEFPHPMIECFQEKKPKKPQFTPDSHQMMLFGICQNCHCNI